MPPVGKLSVAKVHRRNAWRCYVRGVAFGDGRRLAGQSLKDARKLAGLPPGRRLGRGLDVLGLTEDAEVSERQLELLFGKGRHPDADRVERGVLDYGAGPAAARLATGAGVPARAMGPPGHGTRARGGGQRPGAVPGACAGLSGADLGAGAATWPARGGHRDAAFHPLWGDVTADDVAWLNEHVDTETSGAERSLTSHLTAGCSGMPPKGASGPGAPNAPQDALPACCRLLRSPCRRVSGPCHFREALSPKTGIWGQNADLSYDICVLG